jgi:hypothetical protein
MVRQTVSSLAPSKPFESGNRGMVSELLDDYFRALTFRAIYMDMVSPSVILLLLLMLFMSLLVFGSVALASILTGGLNLNAALSYGIAAFGSILIFSLLAGLIYRLMLSKTLDTSYITYPYVVALSLAYYPFAIGLGYAFDSFKFYFFIVVAIISQYLLNVSMLNGYEFESSRESFIFTLATFILQWGYLLVFSSLSAKYMPAGK